MLNLISRDWWVFALRGVAAILFGIMGVLGIVASIVTLVWPGITALSLLYVVAFWAIAMGVFQVISAIELRKVIDNELWMALGGVLSVVFGAFLIASPGDGLVSLVWILGFWAIVFGASSLGLAFRLRGISAAQHKPQAAS